MGAHLEQDKIVAIVGKPSQGKATIMRLIAGQLIPGPGNLSPLG